MKSSTLRQIGILGTGSYVPEHILTNADLEKMVDTSDEWIRTRTGIRERRIAESGTSTVSLAKKAAEKAIADAGVTAEEIDLVVVATCTQDTIAPSTACALQDILGIPAAGAFDLSAGCSGFVYATAVASQMLATGLYQKALVVGAEVLSRFVDWTDRNTCVLFGDGAGAVVLGEVAT
ncbi:MAG: beta-ketoacyl-ACP synthase 3, partial [Negativicoccus succinicivorans]|nr:beta-ketoacyl-ACP synthase 3 [Negativicoccus succinicivorans]